MNDTTLFHAVIVGSFFALGIGAEHMRIRWAMRKKRKARREFLGVTRRNPEPVWGAWSADFGRVLGRK